MSLFSKPDPLELRPDVERAYQKRPGFFRILRERLHYREGEKMRIVCDFWLYEHDGKPNYRRSDCWTAREPEELHKAGYLPSIRTPGYDNIAWWRVPIFARIHDGFVFDIHRRDADGNLLYSQDTPNTLEDELRSNAVRDFIKGLFKTSLPTMDLQKILMIGILGVGAVFGLMMLGVI